MCLFRLRLRKCQNKKKLDLLNVSHLAERTHCQLAWETPLGLLSFPAKTFCSGSEGNTSFKYNGLSVSLESVEDFEINIVDTTKPTIESNDEFNTYLGTDIDILKD